MSLAKKIIWKILGTSLGTALIVRPVWQLQHDSYWQKTPALSIDMPHGVLKFRPENKETLGIHLDNETWLQLQQLGTAPAQLSAWALEDLHAAAISPGTSSFKTFSFQSIHRRLMQDWGMEIVELPRGLAKMFEQFYAEGFIVLYHPRGTARLLQGVPTIAEGLIAREKFAN